jgi:predicted SAM-dependent methyltransferase
VYVNIGCGDRYVQGWVNVDHEGSPHQKDITLDITKKLPWEPDSIIHVYMGHVLEHLTIQQAKSLLKRLKPLVQPIGQILVVGPDVDIAREMASVGTLDVTLESLTDGGHRWPGDEHKWECTTTKIIGMLKDTGWRDIQNVGINDVAAFWPVADRNPKWQLAVTARS